MTTQRFVSLSERLLRAGIAPRHVKRLIAELEAHFSDLVAELQSTGLPQAESEAGAAIRLGTEEVLAASIIARPELRSWARRWPWLAFVVLPLLSLAVRFVLSILAAVGVITFGTEVLGVTALHPGPIPWICKALQAYALWIAPVLAAGAACFFAARRGAPALWPIVGCTLIALVGAMTNAGFSWSLAVPRGVLSAGIGFRFPGADPAMGLRLTLTLVVILVPFSGSGIGRTERIEHIRLKTTDASFGAMRIPLGPRRAYSESSSSVHALAEHPLSRLRPSACSWSSASAKSAAHRQ